MVTFCSTLPEVAAFIHCKLSWILLYCCIYFAVYLKCPVLMFNVQNAIDFLKMGIQTFIPCCFCRGIRTSMWVSKPKTLEMQDYDSNCIKWDSESGLLAQYSNELESKKTRVKKDRLTCLFCELPTLHCRIISDIFPDCKNFSKLGKD